MLCIVRYECLHACVASESLYVFLGWRNRAHNHSPNVTLPSHSTPLKLASPPLVHLQAAGFLETVQGDKGARLGLVALMHELEDRLNGPGMGSPVPVPRMLASPFRAPVAKFLNKCVFLSLLLLCVASSGALDRAGRQGRTAS